MKINFSKTQFYKEKVSVFWVKEVTKHTPTNEKEVLEKLRKFDLRFR